MKKNEKSVKVFVYGTLKQGRALHQAYMRNAVLVGKDYVSGMLYEYGSLPVLFPSLGGGLRVEGEVYDIPADDFASVREMEECSGYLTAPVETSGGEKVYAFFADERCFRRKDCTEVRSQEGVYEW